MFKIIIKMKKILSLILFIPLLLNISGCDKTYSKVNKSFLYGIDEILCGGDSSNLQNTGVKDFDIDKTIELLKRLGTKSLRFRIPKCFMTTTNGKVDELAKNYLLETADKLNKAGVTNLIGSSQWIQPNYINVGSSVPEYASNEYVTYMNEVSSWWEVIAKTFPMVNKWEVLNEPNGDFIKYYDRSLETPELKAKITTDYMYYAREGIKKGNDKAGVVLPGIAPFTLDAVKDFLTYIYDYIHSGNAPAGKEMDKNEDHYFDYLCWHVYFNEVPTIDNLFTDFNDAIYEVAKNNNDNGKPLIITEFGFPDHGYDVKRKAIAEYYKSVYKEAEKLKYLETLCVFRLYNEEGSSWGSTNERYYGLFNEPTEIKGFAPKPQAYAIQEAFKGKGELNIYE